MFPSSLVISINVNKISRHRSVPIPSFPMSRSRYNHKKAGNTINNKYGNSASAQVSGPLDESLTSYDEVRALFFLNLILSL